MSKETRVWKQQKHQAEWGKCARGTPEEGRFLAVWVAQTLKPRAKLMLDKFRFSGRDSHAIFSQPCVTWYEAPLSALPCVPRQRQCCLRASVTHKRQRQRQRRQRRRQRPQRERSRNVGRIAGNASYTYFVFRIPYSAMISANSKASIRLNVP